MSRPQQPAASWTARTFQHLGILLLLLPAAVGLPRATGSPAAAQDLLLRGGRLIDPSTRTVRTADLWIVDGVIREAPIEDGETSAGDPAADKANDQAADQAGGRIPDLEVLDVRGKWVLPGLRDFHVHSEVNQGPRGQVDRIGIEGAARRMLYAGVTGFLDLFHVEDVILPLRDRQRASRNADRDDVPGADIFAAGPCLTATDGHCTEYRIPTRIIDTPEDARREIDELATKRPDVVKLVYEHPAPELEGKSWRKARPSLDRPTLEAAVAAARARGLATVVHIRSWQDVEHVVEAGATVVTHLPGFQPIPDGLAKRMAERGTVVIPTLAVGDPVFVLQPERREDPLLRAVLDLALLAAYRDIDPDQDESSRQMLGGLRRAQGHRLESLEKLAAAGVPLVAGTDAGNPMTAHGYSLHRELELMVEAGLTPWQTLAAATTAAGELVGRSWGLQPGDEGTLLVLDASPLEDIRNTRKIHRVIHHGVPVDRDRLRQELQKATSSAKPSASPAGRSR